MSIGLWIGIAIAVVAVVLAAVIRSLRPKQFEPVEMEFDMRALKQIQSQAESKSADMAKLVKQRELNNRLDALLESSAAETPRSSSDASDRR